MNEIRCEPPESSEGRVASGRGHNPRSVPYEFKGKVIDLALMHMNAWTIEERRYMNDEFAKFCDSNGIAWTPFNFSGFIAIAMGAESIKLDSTALGRVSEAVKDHWKKLQGVKNDNPSDPK